MDLRELLSTLPSSTVEAALDEHDSDSPWDIGMRVAVAVCRSSDRELPSVELVLWDSTSIKISKDCSMSKVHPLFSSI